MPGYAGSKFYDISCNIYWQSPMVITETYNTQLEAVVRWSLLYHSLAPPCIHCSDFMCPDVHAHALQCLCNLYRGSCDYEQTYTYNSSPQCSLSAHAGAKLQPKPSQIYSKHHQGQTRMFRSTIQTVFILCRLHARQVWAIALCGMYESYIFFLLTRFQKQKKKT
jgi:hypothetical protein